MSRSESDSAGAQLSEHVKALADKFLQRTAGQILVFQQQLAALAAGDRGVLTPIAEVAHKIHGSGAVFGFPAISESAGKLEELSERLAAESGFEGEPPVLQWSQQLTECVAELSAALHEAVRSAGKSK
ncbi:MAG: Hpt domain-containing protein [Xanthobacteraceae bacterium]|nr:Hpt domain-containing protein [Xanthobacteraceae bacterium]